MGGVAADGHQERVRDRHAQPFRYTASAASPPRLVEMFAGQERVQGPTVLNTVSSRAL